MANLGTLYAHIGLDNSQLIAGQRQAETVFGAIKSSAMRLGAVVGVALGGREVIRGVESLINSYAEAESSMRRVRTAVESTGVSWDGVKERIADYTMELQKSTRFSDEEAQVALQRITQLTGNLSKGFEGTQIALNMASSGMFDVESASLAVARAMGGNIMMLTRMGIITKAQSEQIEGIKSATERWAVVQAALNQKFGGAAQKDLETYAGSLQSLKNWVDEVKESLGGAIAIQLAPKFREWKAAIIDFIESGRLDVWVREVSRGFRDLADIFSATIGAIIKGFREFWENLQSIREMQSKALAPPDITPWMEFMSTMRAWGTGILLVIKSALESIANAFAGLLKYVLHDFIWNLMVAFKDLSGVMVAAFDLKKLVSSPASYLEAIRAGIGQYGKDMEKIITDIGITGDAMIKSWSNSYQNMINNARGFWEGQTVLPPVPGFVGHPELPELTTTGIGKQLEGVKKSAEDTKEVYDWLDEARREMQAEQIEEDKAAAEAWAQYTFEAGNRVLETRQMVHEASKAITAEEIEEWRKAHEFEAGLYQGLGDIAANTFKGMFDNSKSFVDNITSAMKSFWDFMINLMAQLLAQWITMELAKTAITEAEAAKRAAAESGGGGGGGIGGWLSTGLSILSFFFKEGGLIGMQTGGLLKGLRSSRDNLVISAMAGEYMVNRPTVQAIGVPAFDYMQRTHHLPPTGGGGGGAINIEMGGFVFNGMEKRGMMLAPYQFEDAVKRTMEKLIKERKLEI